MRCGCTSGRKDEMVFRGCCWHCAGDDRGGGSDRDSNEVSGSEGRPEADPQRRRRYGGGSSSKRRRATYRYEVVYRREEFSHDYLDGRPFRPEESPLVRHAPIAQPQLGPLPHPPRPLPPSPDVVDSAAAFLRRSDYSHLSNYAGHCDELHPHSATGLNLGWRPFQAHQPHYPNHSPCTSSKLSIFYSHRIGRTDPHCRFLTPGAKQSINYFLSPSLSLSASLF